MNCHSVLVTVSCAGLNPLSVSIGLILNFTLYYLNLIPSLPGFNHFSYDKVSSTVLML